jgi:polynucleotide 5'-hydroxyl-kinase GRC3/NOL9
MVMGGIDSGKSSFCTFLANQALLQGRNVAVIDADVGQSDIGPPSTIGLGYVTKPIKELFDLGARNLYFVGSTSPNGVVERVIKGISLLEKGAIQSGVNFLIINTDGWTEGKDAKTYKVLLVQKADPTVVVGMQQQDELKPIIDELKDTRVLEAVSPAAIMKRDREKRKILREMGYKKYLAQAKVRSFPLSWVKVDEGHFNSGFAAPRNRIKMISEMLGASPIYWTETPEALFIILKEGQRTNSDGMNKIKETVGKKVKVIRQGEEEGLIVALQNDQEDMLGIGILCGIDYYRRVISVYTSTKEKVSKVCIGQVKLDKMGREIGLSRIFTDWTS